MTESGRVETAVREMLGDLAHEAGDDMRIAPRTVRRARLRRARTVTALGVTAMLVLYGALVGSRALRGAPRPSPMPAVHPTTPPPVKLPQSVQLVRTYQLQPAIVSAAAGEAFGVILTKSTSWVWIVRIDPDGTVRRAKLRDPLSDYFSNTAAQGQALYIGTSVIQRFTSAADELLRIDAATLTVTARVKLPGGVYRIVADPQDVWVALADRILRLDPVSLEVRASFRFPGAFPPPRGLSSVSSLARGPGGLWATFGDVKHETIYRFDPASLAVLSQTDVPVPGQGIELVAGPESVWLTGTDFVRPVDQSGRLGRMVRLVGLDPYGAAAQGRGLVALVPSNASEALVQIGGDGLLVASSEVGDAGALLAVDGRNVWLYQGLRFAQWQLVNLIS